MLRPRLAHPVEPGSPGPAEATGLRANRLSPAGWLAATLFAGLLSASPDPGGCLPSLTEAERAAGWRLLFDGQSPQGWRGVQGSGFPNRGWEIKEGCLKRSGPGGGDLVTEDTFENFEFVFEWRMAPNGNSGVKYFVAPERGKTIGHEYQLLTGGSVEAAQAPAKGGTAGFYDILPPIIPIRLRPANQFNESRILVRGRQVEHWLNGELTLAYELGSPEVLTAVASSKFKGVKGFGTKVRGHLLLQDHGGEVFFRNLKIREFPD